ASEVAPWRLSASSNAKTPLPLAGAFSIASTHSFGVAAPVILRRLVRAGPVTPHREPSVDSRCGRQKVHMACRRRQIAEVQIITQAESSGCCIVCENVTADCHLRRRLMEPHGWAVGHSEPAGRANAANECAARPL